MSEFRSAAEQFVTDFLDYMYKEDILDHFNNKTQKMERSAGVEALVKQAQRVFPARADDGKKETDKLTPEQIEQAVKGSPETVIDTREMFARKIQKNGGTRALLRGLYNNEPGVADKVREFFEAEDGDKEFAKE